MKRSKIFLSLTAGLLATAAFVSAKAKFLIIPTCYLEGTRCFPNPNDFIGQTIQTGSQLFTVIHSIRYNLYTNVSGDLSCINPVYREN